MAARARQRARLVPKIAERITFLDSDAANVPLPDETVDIALASHSLTAIHARDVPRAKGLDDEDVRLRYEAKQEAVTEILRTLKPGGWFFSVSASPGALGGELTDVVLDDKVETWNSGKRQFLEWMREGYRFQSVSVEADWVFPSPKIAARSYGFIFGPDAIGAILKQHITRVRNPVVLQYLRKP